MEEKNLGTEDNSNRSPECTEITSLKLAIELDNLLEQLHIRVKSIRVFACKKVTQMGK